MNQWQQIEKNGPPNLLVWEASWQVFRVALIGLGIARPGVLDS